MLSNKKTKKATQKKLSTRAIVLIAVASAALIALLIVGGVHIYNRVSRTEIPVAKSHALDAEPPYADGTEVFEKNTFAIKEGELFDMKALLTSAQNMDESKTTYQVIVQQKGASGSFEMNYWMEDEKGFYEYIFDGYDVGIDLDGHYYRTVMDKIPTIIEYRTGKYITSTTDAEFFGKYHGVLSDLTVDNIVGELLSADFIETGKNVNGGKVLIGEKIKVCIYEDGEYPVIMVLDERGDTPVGYYICYGMTYAMPSVVGAE